MASTGLNTLPLTCGIALALAGCGSSGGGGGSDDAGGPVPGGEDDDLSLFGQHYHQDFYSGARGVNFLWSVANSFPERKSIEYVIRRGDGPAMVSGTISVGSFQEVFDGHNHGHRFDGNSPGVHDFTLTLDPENKITEANENNNSYTFRVIIPDSRVPEVANDLRFNPEETTHFHAKPGNRLGFHVRVFNSGSETLSGVRFTIRGQGQDFTGTFPDIPANGGAESTHEFTAPVGEWEYRVEIDSGRTVDEANEDNNVLVFPVIVTSGSSG